MIRGLILFAAMVGAMPNAEVGERNAVSVSVRGTLVVVVPFNGGLIVASDTRSTLLGVACDGFEKIHLLARSEPSFLAATGTSVWMTARVPLWEHDPCGDLKKNGITYFDAKKTIAAYLDTKDKAAISELDLTNLGQHIINEIINVHRAHPEFVRSFAGKNIFQIVLGSYDATKRMSYVRALQIDMTPNFAVK